MKQGETSKVVPFVRSRRLPDPARVAEFASMARRLQRERAESADVVTRALRDTPREQWPSLAARPELMSSGALDRLAALGEELERDPNAALAVAELATAIADALPPDSYPRVVIAQLRAHAWKDRARALCYLARYDDALSALDRAQAELLPLGTLAHDQAILDLVRSTVLQHLRRYSEAEALLSECRQVFTDFGDERLYRQCTVACGNLLVRRGDYRAARELLAPLIRDGDPDSIARARFALGWSAIHLGMPEEALEHFRDAQRRSRQRGADLEAVRAAYGAGSALLHLGRLDEAVEKLRYARKELLGHALVEEAGLSALELVEVHMLRGEAEEARTLSATVVREFADAGLSRRALTALAYLNDAIAASSATPETVRNVHAYITELRHDPARELAMPN
ncbi:MAG TPA: tetratricopeptide repeat protein [Thermoanaerobaculia bacterium]|jgi:tetratricopeptide (TPR) repeat protein